MGDVGAMEGAAVSEAADNLVGLLGSQDTAGSNGPPRC